ncbi:MFS transporter [Actinomyces sp. oral taxon 414]|uniref:pseudouridine synthase n=1 Tax=Actinomyces sp. oral taxon 414 TaxID=712122 RepID=UPI0006AFF636|nr:pseudouridine synthase [Actinomyces sp. oral taxon 414]ALC99155.1 MFS transporter [Actinomyces sp. oral taxon 414]
MTHDRETVDLTGEEFYDEDDLEELDEPDETAGADAPAGARPGGGAKDPHVPGGERLHKVLAHAGVASRRACEGLIAAGRVSVDGVVVTDQGVRVDPATQVIRVDGSRIIADPDILTVVLHKPAGVVTTMADPDGRPTVADFARRHLQAHAGDIAHPERVRLVHVGRLDTDTEGLLLLSNDGELAHRLMHPGYEIPKTYVAIVTGRVEPWAARKLRRGIELEDGPARADRVTIKDSGPAGSIVEITLHSGRNRIVRRMLDAVGHPVTRLVRTGLGPLRIGGLGPGRMRRLSGEELAALQREVGL